MNFEAMRGFLSEENIGLHKSYLGELKLKYSVLVKSAPALVGLSLSDIWRKIPRSDVKNEALSLLSEIKAHEIYFESFSKKRVLCPEVRKAFGSESSFLYTLFSQAKQARCGFLYIYCDSGVRYEIREDGGFFFKSRLPILAIDLFEHAYFKDYSFDRSRYLEGAVYSLDLSKIGESSKKD